MNFWNYIGEFLLFRWLFGSHKHDRDTSDMPNSAISPDNSDSLYDIDSQSDDDFLDEQDDYDMMDDDF